MFILKLNHQEKTLDLSGTLMQTAFLEYVLVVDWSYRLKGFHHR